MRPMPATPRSLTTDSGGYKWAVVGMLWFVCFFNYADRQAIFSVLDPIKDEMKLSDEQLGRVGSAFMWVYALASPLAGFVGDRFRRKTLILSGLLFWSVICAATALSTRYEHLVLFRALEGFGEAFYFPASMALVSSFHGPKTRSRAMGLHQSSVYIGTGLGGYLGGAMGQHFGWRSSFYWLGAGGIVLGLALYRLLREPESSQSQGAVTKSFSDWWSDFAASVGTFFAAPPAVLLMLVFMGANFVAGIFLTWLPTFLKRKFEMSLALSGFSAGFYLQFASIIGVLAGGALADSLSRRWKTGRMVTQVFGLVLGVPFIFITGRATTVELVVIAMTGFGFFKGIYDSNIWAALHDWVPPEHRAASVGFMNSVGWLSASIGVYCVGWASDRYGLSAAISASSLAYLLVGLLLLGGIWIVARRGSVV